MWTEGREIKNRNIQHAPVDLWEVQVGPFSGVDFYTSSNSRNAAHVISRILIFFIPDNVLLKFVYK